MRRDIKTLLRLVGEQPEKGVSYVCVIDDVKFFKNRK